MASTCTPHFGLYDLFGREVYATDLQDFITDIPLARVPAGVYAWRVCTYAQWLVKVKSIRYARTLHLFNLPASSPPLYLYCEYIDY